MNRRGLASVAAVAVVAVSVLGAVGFWLTRPIGSTPTAALDAPHFVEEAIASGIDHAYDGDFAFAVGGGLAVFDCSGDGFPDLYLAGGNGPATLYRNKSPIGGDLRFVAIDDPTIALTGVEGAYPLDVDGDGNVDLVVLRDGENVVLRGLGDCRFEPANAALALDGGDQVTAAFSATWENDAMLPTLAFGNYLVDPDHPDPDHLCSDNQLVRPRPGVDRYDPAISLTPAWCALSMLFSDWDRSGRRDLRVSNDRQYYSDLSDGQEQLWRIAPDEPPRLYGEADGWVLYRIWGMGIASQDVNGDGYPEAYLTSQGPNVLQTLLSGPSQPMFRDIALKRGVEATRPSSGGDPLPSTSWHPEFVDVNNDAFMDLFVSKGNVAEQADFATMDPSDLFLGQPDGTFVEVAEAAGILDYARGRGASLADLNLDGLPDLVEVNYGDRVNVWRNVGAGDAERPLPMGHWIGLRLVETGPNRDAIGAWVEVRMGDATTSREMIVGGGHVSGQLGWLHFGLGLSEEAQVRVTWPDGETGPWQRVTADAFAVIERDAPRPRVWQPGIDRGP